MARRPDLLLIAAIAVMVLWPVIASIGHSYGASVNFLVDDSYYYLGMARSLVEGHGTSFGGLVESNGYQPLWLAILALAWKFTALPALATPATLAQGITLCLSLTAMIVLAAAILCWRAPVLRRDSTALLIALWLCLLLFPMVFLGGMEPVLFLLFIPFFRQLRSLQPTAKAGALFFLLFLVRLDALSLFLGWSLLYLLQQPLSFARVMALLKSPATVVFAAGLLLYAALNQWYYGVPLPVSGLNKSVGSVFGENLPVTLQFASLSRYALCAMLACWLLHKLLRKRFTIASDTELVLTELLFTELLFTEQVFMIATLVCALYYGTLSGWPVWTWYLWAPGLWLLFSATRLVLVLAQVVQVLTQLHPGAGRGHGLASFIGAICLVLVLATSYLVTQQRIRHTADITFKTENARLVETVLPTLEPGVIAMGDRAGSLGYALPAGFRFLHLEGLVADRAFLDARRRDQLADYLDTAHLRYVLVDRETFLRDDISNILAVVEPAQGDSLHAGIVTLCFPPQAVLDTQHYAHNQRILFDYRQHATCPESIRTRVAELAQHYSGIRSASNPSELESTVGRMRQWWSHRTGEPAP